MTGLVTHAGTSRATGSHGRLDTEVRAIMRAGVVTISEQASLRQAFRAVALHQEGAVLATDHTGAPVGWITQPGLLAWADTDSEQLTASAAIDGAVVRIHPTATARQALALLREHEASQLLVAHADDAAPEGVVSAGDLIRLVAREA
jgi:CBS domain-containing protein